MEIFLLQGRLEAKIKIKDSRGVSSLISLFAFYHLQNEWGDIASIGVIARCFLVCVGFDFLVIF
jgi:hypothetical protein